MIAATSTLSELAPYIVAITAAGGLAGGITALLRVRPESGKLVVEAAEGAVVVQSGVITSLREELDKLRKDLDAELDRRELCESRLDVIEPELEHLRDVLRRAGLNGQDRPAGAPPSSAST